MEHEFRRTTRGHLVSCLFLWKQLSISVPVQQPIIVYLLNSEYLVYDGWTWKLRQCCRSCGCNQEYIITRVSNLQYPRRNTVVQSNVTSGVLHVRKHRKCIRTLPYFCSICTYLEGAWSSANVISSSHAAEKPFLENGGHAVPDIKEK